MSSSVSELNVTPEAVRLVAEGFPFTQFLWKEVKLSFEKFELFCNTRYVLSKYVLKIQINIYLLIHPSTTFLSEIKINIDLFSLKKLILKTV
jgi:hypothetical protein